MPLVCIGMCSLRQDLAGLRYNIDVRARDGLLATLLDLAQPNMQGLEHFEGTLGNKVKVWHLPGLLLALPVTSSCTFGINSYLMVLFGMPSMLVHGSDALSHLLGAYKSL